MNTIPLLHDLAIIAAVGVLTAVVLSRLRLPTVAGLLAAGALIGPAGLALVHDPEHVDDLAEIGVVLLLFTVGLEFSMERLRRIARHVAVGGTLQVGLTIAVAVAVALALGQSAQRGVFFGFLFALSSTAIVLRALTERGEVDAPHGRFIVGALIYQDLCVVPMVLIVPILGGQAVGSPGIAIAVAMGKAAGMVLAALALSRLVVPRLFAWVDSSRSRELFLLAVLGVCIGTAWLTSLAGLSLALGAFLAGVVLADGDYRYRALSDVLPLRDAFSSVFFVSLGTLFDVRVVFESPAAVALMLAGFLVAKGVIAALAAVVMRFPSRAAWMAGIGLANFGEFGFVLAKMGESAGLLAADESRALLGAGIISMFVTPLAVRAAPRLSAGAAIFEPLEKLLGARGIAEPEPQHAELSGHVVLVGYGVAGALLERALSEGGVPHLVLELNAERVRASRAQGVPIYYGDISSPETLEHARVQHAVALVLLINDPEAARRAIVEVRRFCPQVPVFVRTRYAGEQKALEKLGASDVVSEEIEAGVEMLARVLRLVGMPGNVVRQRVREVRSATQRSARDAVFRRPRLRELGELAEMKVDNFLVRAEDAACGRDLVRLNLRSQTRALVVAIRRDGQLIEDPDPAEALRAGDVLYLVGSGPAIRAASRLLETGEIADKIDPAA